MIKGTWADVMNRIKTGEQEFEAVYNVASASEVLDEETNARGLALGVLYAPMV